MTKTTDHLPLLIPNDIAGCIELHASTLASMTQTKGLLEVRAGRSEYRAWAEKAVGSLRHKRIDLGQVEAKLATLRSEEKQRNIRLNQTADRRKLMAAIDFVRDTHPGSMTALMAKLEAIEDARG